MNGWKQEEDMLLLTTVKQARKDGKPLQSAFAAVAEKTNRKRDSIRNRYYLVVKPRLSAEPQFTPFSDEECNGLLREMLIGQSNGESVRACAMRLANGDSKKMLRFQNKYRSLLKTEPQRVDSIRKELEEAGNSVPNPYCKNEKHTATHKKIYVSEQAIRKLLDTLYEDLIALSKEDVS